MIEREIPRFPLIGEEKRHKLISSPTPAQVQSSCLSPLIATSKLISSPTPAQITSSIYPLYGRLTTKFIIDLSVAQLPCAPTYLLPKVFLPCAQRIFIRPRILFRPLSNFEATPPATRHSLNFRALQLRLSEPSCQPPSFQSNHRPRSYHICDPSNSDSSP